MIQIETSPFVFDGPAPPGDVVGRAVEVAALTDRAMNGRFVLLYAPRRYGKTSLIHKVAHNAAETNDLVVVMIDFLGVQTIEDLSNRLAVAFRHLPKTAFANALRKKASRHPELSAEIGFAGASVSLGRGDRSAPQLFEELLRLPYDVATELDARVLMVLDEFQAVTEVANAEAIIRSVIQHQRDRLSYLFAGSEQSILTSMFGTQAAPLYGQAEQFRLGRLYNDELADLIEEKFEATGRAIGAALGPLLDTARGHPQRAMFLAHHVWEATPNGAEADLDVWESALDDALARSQHEFVAVEAGLEPGQRKTARLLAWHEPLYGAAAGRLDLPKGTATGAALALEKRSLAWRPFNEELELVDPLLAAWIRRRDPRP